jgi:hypothetical protein
MKKSMMLFCCFLLAVIIGNDAGAQHNNIFSLPFKYREGGVLKNFLQPSGGYAGQQAQRTHNAMQDANGNLLFFMVDHYLYDKDGIEIAAISDENQNPVNGNIEACIVPDPANCDKYYIFTSRNWGNYPADNNIMEPCYITLDMSTKTVTTYNVGGITSYVKKFLPPTWNNVPKGANVTYAATKLRSDNSRFLFMSDGQSIYRYKIDATGVNYDNYFYTIAGVALTNDCKTEFELVELNSPLRSRYRIALGAVNNTSMVVFSADLTATGTVISNTVRSFNYPKTVKVAGLEFSPSGRFLYATHTLGTTGYNNAIDYFDCDNNFTRQALLVPNASDFDVSQIEMGANGWLYFVRGGSLAAFKAPENPGSFNPSNPSLTWNASQVSLGFAYDKLTYNIGTSVWEIRALPDQIDGMNYSAHFTASLPCCIANISYSKNTYTSLSGSYTWSPTQNPLNNNGGSVATIKDEIVIPAGSNITIENMEIRFSPNARLVIKNSTGSANGGRLTLKNCTLTVDPRCSNDALWQGFIVEGNNQAQGTISTSKHGWLVLENNTVIEHAVTGATFGTSTKLGGGVTTSNSKIKNCITGVDFLPYNSTAANLSVFNNTTIEVNQNLKQSAAFGGTITLARLVNNSGVTFTKCTLQNDASQYSNLIVDGINANRSAIKVKGNCTSSNPGCGQRSVFKNLQHGIFYTTSNSSISPNIIQSDFINNRIGIYVSGASLPYIVSNNFEIPSGTSNRNAFTGIYLNATPGMRVEENNFTTYNFNSNSLWNFGIVANETTSSTKEIYKNNFSNIWVGIQAIGLNQVRSINMSSSSGLLIRCNDFISQVSSADISVTLGNQPPNKAGIYHSQGNCHSNTDGDRAGNKFSHTGGASCISMNQGVIGILYAQHTDQVTTPQNYTSNVSPTPCTMGIALSENTCASKVYSGKTIGDLTTGISVLEDLITDLREIFDDTNDPEIASEIEANVLKRHLLTETLLSLYLADENCPNPLDSVIFVLQQELLNWQPNTSIYERLSLLFLEKGDLNNAINYRDLVEHEKGTDYFCALFDELRNWMVESSVNTLYQIPNEQLLHRILEKYDFLDNLSVSEIECPITSATARGLLLLANPDYEFEVLFEEPETYYFLSSDSLIEPLAITITSIASTNEKQNELKIYPNPAKDNLTIEYTFAETNTRRIEIRNMLGQQMLSRDISEAKGRLNIELSSLAKGVYVVTIMDGTLPAKQVKLVVE